MKFSSFLISGQHYILIQWNKTVFLCLFLASLLDPLRQAKWHISVLGEFIKNKNEYKQYYLEIHS